MKAVRTCDAYPTQYDLFLDDGRYAYFRYRNGCWSLALYRNKSSFWATDPIAEVGAEFAAPGGTGYMTHSEVMGLLEIALPSVLQEAAA